MPGWDDLIDEFANATATFEAESQVGTTTDRYGSEQEDYDWAVVEDYRDVPVRYEPRAARMGGMSEFLTTQLGDDADVQPRLYASGELAGDVGPGTRVTIDRSHMTETVRVQSADYVTLDADDTGVLVLAVEEMGDTS